MDPADQSSTDVNTFESNPSIKWWFVTSALIFVFVVLLYFIFKMNEHSPRNTKSLRREGYEALYEKFARFHPKLWSVEGPDNDFKPANRGHFLKWRLLKTWFDADKVKIEQAKNTDEENFGTVGILSVIRRWLAWRWLDEIDRQRVNIQDA